MSVTKQWKCYACEDDRGRPGKPFIDNGIAPTCPTCKVSKTSDLRENELIVPMETIHFQPTGDGLKSVGQVKPFSPGRNEVACAPGKPIVSMMRFTGTASAVTCLACLAALNETGAETAVQIVADAAAG